MRLHLDASLEHLNDAGAVLFAVEARRDASALNTAAFARLTDRLVLAERSLATLPLVAVVLRSTGVRSLTDRSVEHALAPLGLATNLALEVSSSDAGAPARVLDALTAVLRDTLASGLLVEAGQHAVSARVLARRCLGAHYERTFGAPGRALAPRSARAPLVLEHPPTPARAWWTYATAGLSLHARETGAERRLELLAYTAVPSPTAVEALLAASASLLGPWAREPIAAFDTLDVSALDRLDVSRLILSPAREPAALLDFPSPDRVEHRGFLQAIAEPARVRFLELFPVTAAELEQALHDGARAVLGLSASHRPGPRERWTAPVPVSELTRAAL